MDSIATALTELPLMILRWLKIVAFDNLIRTLLKIAWEKLSDWRRSVWYHLKVWFPALQAGSTRQRALESVYNQVRSDVPAWFALNSLDLLDHNAEERCYSLARLGKIVRAFHYEYHDNRDPKSASLVHKLYYIARIRSRIKSCCWTNAKLHDIFTISWLSKDKPAWQDIDLATLAWLCRGEIGRYDLQHDMAGLKWPFAPHLVAAPHGGEERDWPTDNQGVHHWPTESRRVFPRTQAEEWVTYEVLLLLELGCNLQLSHEHGGQER